MADTPTHASEDELYKVERILAERSILGNRAYLVKWEGYPDEECTWEPKESFSEPQTIIDWEKQRDKGDFLDEEEVEAVERRMGDFLARQSLSSAANAGVQPPTLELQQKHVQPTNLLDFSMDSQSDPESDDMPTTKPPIRSSRRKHPAESTTPSSNARKRTTLVSSPSTSDDSDSREWLNPNRSSRPGKGGRLNRARPGSNSNSTFSNSSDKTELPATTKSPQMQKPQGMKPVTKSNLRPEPAPEAQSKQRPPSSHDQNLPTTQPARDKGVREDRTEHSVLQKDLTEVSSDLRRNTEPSEIDDRGEASGQISSAMIETVAKERGNEHLSLFIPYDEADDNVTSSGDGDGANLLAEVDRPARVASSAPDPVALQSVTGAFIQVAPTPHMAQIPDDRPTSTSSTTLSKENLFHEKAAAQASELSVNSTRLVTEQSEDASFKTVLPTSQYTDTPRSIYEDKSGNSVVSRYMQYAPTGPLTSSAHGLVKTTQGRIFNPREEILVQLYFGDNFVGDVKILAFPPWLKTKIMSLKTADSRLEIHFGAKSFKAIDEFSGFAGLLHPRIAATGTIVTYEDTKASMESLIQHLNTYDVCATWVFPDHNETLVLVLYSCRAASWRNFGQLSCVTSEQHLHIVVRNSYRHLDHQSHEQTYGNQDIRSPQTYYPQQILPSASGAPRNSGTNATQGDAYGARASLMNRNRRDSTTGAPQETAPRPRRQSMSTPDKTRPPMMRTNSLSTEASRSRPDGSNSIASGYHHSTHDIESDSVSKMPFTKSKSVTVEDQSPSHTRTVYKPLTFRDFERISTLGPRFPGDRKKPKVFIAFADTNPHEAQLVKQWLGQYISTRSIYDNRVKEEWNEFLDSLDSRGQFLSIVLFHSAVTSYINCSKLGSFLRSDHFVCYNLSFQGPEKLEAEGRISISRIFPRGSVLCVTEGCMVRYPRETLMALRWFANGAVGKGGNWKLILRPKIIDWLLHRQGCTTGVEQKMLTGMLDVILPLTTKPYIKVLCDEDTDVDSVDEFSCAENEAVMIEMPLLPRYTAIADSKLEGSEAAMRARDKLVSEYFLGWAAVEAPNYRRFTMIDDQMTNKTEPFSGHVNILDPLKFIRIYVPDEAST